MHTIYAPPLYTSTLTQKLIRKSPLSLSAREQKRLVKLCGLLSSPNENERSVAAGMASKFLRDRNLSWEDVLMRGQPSVADFINQAKRNRGAKPNRTYYQDDFEDDQPHAELIEIIMDHESYRDELMNKWECSFIKSLHTNWMDHALSSRQWDRLKCIAVKLNTWQKKWDDYAP